MITSRRSFMAVIGAGVGAMVASPVLHAAPPAKNPTVRVAVWETRCGGYTILPKGTYDNVWLVKHLDCDVIVSSGSKTAEEALAKSMGYKVVEVSENFHLFSRFPIEESYISSADGVTVGGIRVTVEGRPVRIFGTRLKPAAAGDAPMSCEAEAKAALKVLAPYLKEADAVPVIFGNAFRPHADVPYADRARCGCHYNRFGMPESVRSVYTDAGMQDTFRKGVLAAGHKTVPLEGDVADKALNAPTRLQALYCGGAKIAPVYSILAGGGFCGVPIKFRGEKRIFASYYGYVSADFRLAN